MSCVLRRIDGREMLMRWRSGIDGRCKPASGDNGGVTGSSFCSLRAGSGAEQIDGGLVDSLKELSSLTLMASSVVLGRRRSTTRFLRFRE